VTPRRRSFEPTDSSEKTPATMRRLIERSLEPRAHALLRSLSEWLPRSVAWDRAMNAAAPILLLEGRPTQETIDPRGAIESSLSNAEAMKGAVATTERIEAAVRAWYDAAARERDVSPQCHGTSWRASTRR
jgi:hypothetical protein